MSHLEQTFKSELLSTSFSNLLSNLALKAKQSSHLPITVAISYAWPFLPEEKDVQERVLRLAEDLQLTGLTVLMDLITGTVSTDFTTSPLDWIRSSHVALMIGSPTYASRAQDPTTLTFLEVLALSHKALLPDKVVPITMAGAFSRSIPPGYSAIMGCSFILPVMYFQDFPTLAAKLLNIHTDPDVQVWLKTYKEDTDRLLRESSLPDPTLTAKQHEQNARFWSSRVLIGASKFTPDQLGLLDGRVVERDRMIDKYCADVMSKVQLPEVPNDTLPGSLPLEPRLLDFLDGPTRVLLLQAPTGAGKKHLCRYLAVKGWNQKGLVPVFLTLDRSKPLNEHLVNQELASHGLDAPTIEQSRLRRSFLIIVDGFDRSQVQTNLYVRYRLQSWAGKAIFTCGTSYLSNAHYAAYYFMPANEHHRADPSGLTIISFNTEYASCVASEYALQPAVHVPAALLKEAKSTAAAQHSRKARERWHKAIAEVCARRHIKTHVIRYTKLIEQGFRLLQEDVVRVIFQQFLVEISSLAAASSSPSPNVPKFLREEYHLVGTHNKTKQPVLQQFLPSQSLAPKFIRKAFISYAWPPMGPERTNLQSRLVQLVHDMALAKIDVTLDILCLRVGMDITEFMRSGIAPSDSVLWIGSPVLKSRIKFKDNGAPDNPATEEFVHILDLTAPRTDFLHLLWFCGDSVGNAYPPTPNLKLKHMDFRREREYFRLVPLVAAKILGIAHLPSFRKRYSTYLAQTKSLESSFSESAIRNRLVRMEEENKQQHAQTEAQLQQLLDAMPDLYRSQQAAANEAQQQALEARLQQVRDKSLSSDSPHAQALQFYIALKGGNKPDAPSLSHFDVGSKVQEFLSQDDPSRILLIQGPAGSGKSLFGRLLERQLWQTSSGDVVPLFVVLTQLRDPYASLAETALAEHGFTQGDAELLCTTKRLVFILDGLDELPVEHFPPTGIVATNQLLVHPNTKVIITSRIHYMASLETRAGTSYQTHLTQGHTALTEFYLMPFDDKQMDEYVQAYAQTKEADWPDWDSYMDPIDSIPGLKELSRNPFVLKLILSAIPRLVAREDTLRGGAQSRTSAVAILAAVSDAFSKAGVVDDMSKSIFRAFSKEFYKVTKKALNPRTESDKYDESSDESSDESGGESADESGDKSGSNKESRDWEVAILLLHEFSRLFKKSTTIAVAIATAVQFINGSMVEGLVELALEGCAAAVEGVVEDSVRAGINSLPPGNASGADKEVMCKRVTSVLVRQIREGVSGSIAQSAEQAFNVGMEVQKALSVICEEVNNTVLGGAAAVGSVLRSLGSTTSEALKNIIVKELVEFVGGVHKAVHAFMPVAEASIPEALKLSLVNTNRLVRRTVQEVTAGNVGKTEVYETFAEQYFEREMWKQLTNGEISLHEDRPARYNALAQRLSQELFQRGTTQAVIDLNQDDLKLLGCMPQQGVTKGSFSFLHKSVLEYFVARSWLQALDLKDYNLLQQIIGARLATSETGLLEFVYRYFRAESHRDILIRMVLASRDSSSDQVTIASANSMTILAATGCCFSLMDLSFIRVPGANLDDILADGTIFRGADLTGVSLRRAWLQNANMENCNLTGSQFGEYPYLRFPEPVRYMGIFKDKIMAVGDCLKLWDLETEQLLNLPSDLHPFSSYEDEVICYGKPYVLWNTTTQQKTVLDYIPASKRLGEVALHQGMVIATGENDDVPWIGVWSIATSQQFPPFNNHLTRVTQIACFENTVATGTKNDVRVWDLSTGQEYCWFKIERLSAIAISQSKIFTGTYEGELQVRDRFSGKKFGTPMQHTKWIACILPIEGMVVSGSGWKVYVWDLATFQQVGQPLTGHSQRVVSLALLKGKILSASEDHTVRVWDLPSFHHFEAAVIRLKNATCLATVGGKFVIGCEDGTVHTWEPEYATIRRVVRPHTLAVTHLALHENWLVSASKDNSVCISDVAASSVGTPLLVGNSFILCLAISSTMVAAGTSQGVKVWNIATHSCLFESNATNTELVAFRGNRLLFCAQNGELQTWDATTGKRATTHRFGMIQQIAMHGNTIATLSMDLLKASQKQFIRKDVFPGRAIGSISVWQNQRMVWNKTTEFNSSLSIDLITPFGIKVATVGSEDPEFSSTSTLDIWDAKTGESLATITCQRITAIVPVNINSVLIVSGGIVQHWRFNAKKRILNLISSSAHDWGLQLNSCKFGGATGLTDKQQLLVQQQSNSNSKTNLYRR